MWDRGFTEQIFNNGLPYSKYIKNSYKPIRKREPPRKRGEGLKRVRHEKRTFQPPVSTSEESHLVVHRGEAKQSRGETLYTPVRITKIQHSGNTGCGLAGVSVSWFDADKCFGGI